MQPITLPGKPLIPALLAVLLLVTMLIFTHEPVVETRIQYLDIEDNPYTQTGERMAELFGAKNLVQVVVNPATESMDEFSRSIDLVKNEIEDAFPGMKVEAITRALPLIYLQTGRNVTVEQALTAAMKIPVASNLVSRDTSSVLMVAFADRVQDFQPARFDSILNRAKPGIKSMAAFSSHHIEDQTGKSITDDYAIMIPVFVFFSIALIYLSYHSISSILFCVINLLLSFIPVLFFITVMDVNINQVTMPAVPVVAILSLSASVHLLTGLRYRHDQGNRSQRIVNTLNHYRFPTFFVNPYHICFLLLVFFSATHFTSGSLGWWQDAVSWRFISSLFCWRLIPTGW